MQLLRYIFPANYSSSLLSLSCQHFHLLLLYILCHKKALQLELNERLRKKKYILNSNWTVQSMKNRRKLIEQYFSLHAGL